MKSIFGTVGLTTRKRNAETCAALRALLALPVMRRVAVLLEQDTAAMIGYAGATVTDRELGATCDLIIGVGGDGSLLHAARSAILHDTPVLGINRGQFGFLTDIRPDEIAAVMPEILAGHYLEERRFMLDVAVQAQDGTTAAQGLALNDAVLYRHNHKRMLEFEIVVNDSFMCRQQADGVIVATPTGSTAYNLSAGGPILHPALDAMVISPMCSHSLNARPVVLAGDNTVYLCASKHPEPAQDAEETYDIRISCDGHDELSLGPEQRVKITKADRILSLLHPPGYDYFAGLRGKLSWGRHLRSDNKSQKTADAQPYSD